MSFLYIPTGVEPVARPRILSGFNVSCAAKMFAAFADISS